MRYWKWEQGRQKGTEYKKLCVWSFRIKKLGFDCYILKYKPKTELKWHTDPVKNGQHWRKNITINRGLCTFLRKTSDGHVYSYFCKNSPWFRADQEKHMLKVYSKPVTKLSFGFVIYN